MAGGALRAPEGWLQEGRRSGKTSLSPTCSPGGARGGAGSPAARSTLGGCLRLVMHALPGRCRLRRRQVAGEADGVVVALERALADALDLGQVFHALERTVRLAPGDDRLRLGLADAVQRIGDGGG